DHGTEQPHALHIFAVEILGTARVSVDPAVLIGDGLHESLVVTRATGQAVIGSDHNAADCGAIAELARPDGAQHVLEVITDDAGFGASSTCRITRTPTGTARTTGLGCPARSG